MSEFALLYKSLQAARADYYSLTNNENERETPGYGNMQGKCFTLYQHIFTCKEIKLEMR